MPWIFDTDRPIYTQLVEQIALHIIGGLYPPGSKIASVRELAAEAQVNPNTMQRALAELENKGLLRSQRTSGRLVTDDTALIESVRNDLAEQVVQDFFKRMNELGYNAETALALAEKNKLPNKLTIEGVEQNG